MNEEELDGKSVRLVAAWNTQEEDVDGLLETLKNSNQDFVLKIQYILPLHQTIRQGYLYNQH